nr:uncharacterized protein LOC109150784 [Ipomoea batatas]GME18240.1 uncharacterized protein LOC109150784 [Ipomoea batatas]
MPVSSVISPSSKSFCSYSNTNLADIAARVVEELRVENENESEFFEDDVFSGPESDREVVGGGVGKEETKEDGDGDEEEFEFEFVTGDAVFSPISADEIFYDGQIRPVYPIRLPLRKLFSKEREAQSSCSSSEADEMDGIPPGTYCVWRPKAAPAEKSSPKKSNSTGWSKRWKLRDLIHRSNSEGKDSFVFLTPSFRKGTPKPEKPAAAAAEASNTADKPATPPHCAKSDGDRRRAFLPHKHDLVGLFGNVNGLSRNLQPF